jgi:hypothetical protein
VRKGRVTHDDN